MLLAGCTTTVRLEDAAEIERRCIEEDNRRAFIQAELQWLQDEGLLKALEAGR